MCNEGCMMCELDWETFEDDHWDVIAPVGDHNEDALFVAAQLGDSDSQLIPRYQESG